MTVYTEETEKRANVQLWPSVEAKKSALDRKAVAVASPVPI